MNLTSSYSDRGATATRSAALATILIVLGVGSAAAQSISGLSITNSSSGNRQQSGTFVSYERESSVAINSSNATSFTGRYFWVIGADTGLGSTHEETMTNRYRVNFTVTAPGAYLLNISTAFNGSMTTVDDGARDRDARADVNGPVSGTQSGGTLQSGSLNFPDPGIRSSGSTGHLPFDLNGSAVIAGTSNGSPVAHQIEFTWASRCRSRGRSGFNLQQGNECAVRGGKTIDYSGESAGNYPGQGNRNIDNDGHFVTVTLVSLCGNGTIDSGEQCDLGGANGSGSSCCTSMCQYRGAGQQCRASSAACDAAETCSGSSASCPADSVAPSGTPCRAAAGGCDQAEACDGSSTSCPADGFLAGGTSCRPSVGNCDVEETCSGSSPVCPGDGFVAGGTPCRPVAGDCDVPESCTGTSGVCPADQFLPFLTECRSVAGACDNPEFCTGVGAACPTDGFKTNLFVCRPGTGDVCDPSENCTGTGPACPADIVSSASTVCRTGSGDSCDPDETCTGVAGQACPADVVLPSTAVCRAGSGIPAGASVECDPTETCTGVAGEICPADVVNPAGTVCNPGSGDPNGSGFVCDPEEVCSGTPLAACPADTIEAAGTVCNQGDGDPNGAGFFCDPDETCSGNPDEACPADTIEPAGTVCNAGSGDPNGSGFVCDPDETCSGVAEEGCPSDTVEPVGTVCNGGSGDPNGSGVICDPDELCTGNADEPCAADDILAAGTLCRIGLSECDTSESCTGAAEDPCGPNINYPDGTACYAGDGIPDPHNPPPAGPLPCNDGECICLGGRCLGPGGVQLVLDRAKMKVSKASRDTGLVTLEGLVLDEETEPAVFGGDFRAQLLGGNVDVFISDAAGFQTTVTLGGCVERPGGRVIVCQDGDVKGTFRLTNAGPVAYDMKLNLKNLGFGETGGGALSPPITASLFQGSDPFYRVERAGNLGVVAGVCNVSTSGTSMKCKEPKELN